eukprot:TRINITY_DN7266_c0_g1_i1.p3 TRINITY_DN7266_c0_g1~~TRINITY_DN7266_c0_g1_i1.p3  ORF type:complete len:50 (-),score=11.25 TRINITY_DN7266_c0_g1_i1:296-445(-)
MITTFSFCLSNAELEREFSKRLKNKLVERNLNNMFQISLDWLLSMGLIL